MGKFYNRQLQAANYVSDLIASFRRPEVLDTLVRPEEQKTHRSCPRDQPTLPNYRQQHLGVVFAPDKAQHSHQRHSLHTATQNLPHSKRDTFNHQSIQPNRAGQLRGMKLGLPGYVRSKSLNAWRQILFYHFPFFSSCYRHGDVC